MLPRCLGNIMWSRSSPRPIAGNISLVVLRRAGVMPAHQVRFYIIFICPILEYAAPVWHPGLTQRQSHQLETVQRLALHSIYPALPYRLPLLTTGLAQLADRRRQLCHDFATSAIESPDFRHWFPRRRRDCHGRELRNSDSFSIPRSTTRFRNNPIIFMSGPLYNSTYISSHVHVMDFSVTAQYLFLSMVILF